MPFFWGVVRSRLQNLNSNMPEVLRIPDYLQANLKKQTEIRYATVAEVEHGFAASGEDNVTRSLWRTHSLGPL